jgi:predicted DNA-binding ribbon-helix-helix protein
VSLEDEFWKGLKEIADGRDMTLSDLVGAIDARRQHGNLSSAIRLFVLDFYRHRLPDEESERNERASPPLVPLPEGDVLLVLCEFSKTGAAYIETNPADANEDAVVRNMLGAHYDRPLRVIAINVGEGWARDVSKKIAGAVLEAAKRDDRDLPRGTRAFVEAQLGTSVHR